MGLQAQPGRQVKTFNSAQNSDGTENMVEGVQESRMSVSMQSTDAALIDAANQWINEAKPLHSHILQKQTRNERYWIGDQLFDVKLDQYQSRMVLNKIFQDLETLIPIATGTIPAPTVSMRHSKDTPKDIDRQRYARDLEEILLAVAQNNKMGNKFREFVRFNQLSFLGVFKFGYDEKEGIWVECIRPQRIMLPPYNSLDYVIEWHEETVGFLIDEFPDKKKEILDTLVSKSKRDKRRGDEQFLNTTVGYYEITTAKVKFWKVQDLVLGVEENPNYDFKNEKKNHWETPKLDYIFSDLWRLGINSYSQTSLVEQTIPIQDAINKRKRQISDITDRSNGVLIGYGQGQMTKDEVAKVEAARKRPNGVVFLEKAAQGSMQEFRGSSPDPVTFQDMLHSESEMDNVFGIHATTRGEKTPGEIPFKGMQLLKEGDIGRHATISNMIELAAEELYNAFAQLIRVHFTSKRYMTYLGKDGTSRYVEIQSNIIEEGLSIKVREGSSLQKDAASRSQEAMLLWQNNAIDLVTLYERLGDPTPYRTAERTFLYQTAPEKLFAQVAAELDRTVKSDSEKIIRESVVQAGIENKALAEGQPVPPFAGATPQHIAVHQELMQSPEFLKLSPEIKNTAATHLEAEVEIIRGQIKTEKEDLQNKNAGGKTGSQ